MSLKKIRDCTILHDFIILLFQFCKLQMCRIIFVNHHWIFLKYMIQLKTYFQTQWLQVALWLLEKSLETTSSLMCIYLLIYLSTSSTSVVDELFGLSSFFVDMDQNVFKNIQFKSEDIGICFSDPWYFFVFKIYMNLDETSLEYSHAKQTCPFIMN